MPAFFSFLALGVGLDVTHMLFVMADSREICSNTQWMASICALHLLLQSGRREGGGHREWVIEMGGQRTDPPACAPKAESVAATFDGHRGSIHLNKALSFLRGFWNPDPRCFKMQSEVSMLASALKKPYPMSIVVRIRESNSELASQVHFCERRVLKSWRFWLPT